MRRHVLLGVGCLLLIGCASHSHRVNPLLKAPVEPPPEAKTAIEAPPAPRAPPPPPPYSTFPIMGAGEGILVGSVSVRTVDTPRFSCDWSRVALRSGGFVELITANGVPADARFHTRSAKGQVFAFALSAGRYEIDTADAVCDGKAYSFHDVHFEDFSSATALHGPQRLYFEVVPGQITYAGALSFSGGGPQGGASVLVENQWFRDSVLLGNTYPLVDWSQRVLGSLVHSLSQPSDDEALPWPLGHLLEDALDKRAQSSPPPTMPGASTAQLEQSCRNGTAEDCFNLGLLSFGGGVGWDRARDLFEKACEGGLVQGCFNLGTLLMQGHGFESPKVDRAVKLFKTVCKKGLAWGCLSLGTLYAEGTWGEYLSQDTAHAIRLYQQACTGGLPEGCFALGLLYVKTPSATNSALAASLFEKSCAGGYQKACHTAAQFKEQAQSR